MTSLFDHIVVNGMELKNRIVKSATLENRATENGLPTDEMRRFYERLARGGSGLVITGYSYINEAGKCYPLQSGVHTDDIIPEWQRINDSVHELGAKIAMQIAHGGRQSDPKALRGQRPVAPSAVPSFGLSLVTRPRRMSEEDIWQTISDFGDAAARVKAAGFDAVQIHAGHGYLISNFLSPFTNRRRDEWGGDPLRRFRFLSEVYSAVRQSVGSSFPVLCKLNVDDFILVGLKPRDSFAAARRLAEMGLDALEISGGTNETPLWTYRGGSPGPVIGQGRSLAFRVVLRIFFGMQKRLSKFHEAYFLPYAKELKPTLSIPLMLVGGIRRPDSAEHILEEGWADFISMARPLIREPGLPNKWLSGNRDAAQCVSCNTCLGEIARENKLRCYRKRSED